MEQYIIERPKYEIVKVTYKVDQIEKKEKLYDNLIKPIQYTMFCISKDYLKMLEHNRDDKALKKILVHLKNVATEISDYYELNDTMK